MQKFDLELAVRHVFQRNRSPAFPGQAMSFEIYDELMPNYTSPTQFLDNMRKRYFITEEQLLLISPAICTRSYNQNQILEKVFEDGVVKYVDFRGKKVEPFHHYDFIPTNVTLDAYLEAVKSARPIDVRRAIASGQVGEYEFAGDLRRGIIKNRRGVIKSKLFLLAEVNAVTCPIEYIEPAEGANVEMQVSAAEKVKEKMERVWEKSLAL
jgi:hypothetical protein